MLTEAQRKARDGKVTASFVPALMAGDEARIASEWLRLIGSPDYAPDDLSDVWAVQLGSYLETFALDWHERRTGRALTRRGEVVSHSELPVCATLDAWRQADGAVLDVKVCGHWRRLDDIIAHYTPQIVVQAACVGTDCGGLLIVHGGAEPAEFTCFWDAEYEAQVWERIGWFWSCVESLTPPCALPAIAAPVKPERVADMRDSNSWAEQAGLWLEHRAAARLFKSAETELKALVPADAKRAHGHGIEIARNKAGSLSIKEART